MGLLNSLRNIFRSSKYENDSQHGDDIPFMNTSFKAGDIMTPMSSCVYINIDDTYDNVLNIVKESPRHYYPVRNKKSNYSGYVSLASLVCPLLENNGDDALRADITERLLCPSYQYHSAYIGNVLHEMVIDGSNVTFVMDETGGLVGVITYKDIIKACGVSLVEHQGIERVSEQVWSVKADASIHDVENAIGQSLIACESYNTIGGLLFYLFNKVPEVGDIIHISESKSYAKVMCTMNGIADTVEITVVR